jgi:hypothetical protein
MKMVKEEKDNTMIWFIGIFFIIFILALGLVITLFNIDGRVETFCVEKGFDGHTSEDQEFYCTIRMLDNTTGIYYMHKATMPFKWSDT